MQLKHAAIYGFGKWVDYSIDFSGEAFTGVYGENESGKSIIQLFILFMLFGLPPKKRNFFRPKTSSKMGGRLTVFDANIGEFTIERFDEIRNGAAICSTPDGQTHDEVWLQERLNGMTHATYQSIFSFSAADLMDIRNMKEEELSEVLLGIGMTGSKNIHAIEKQLETKIGDLFKPFGKKPVINQQLDLLDELHTSLQNYRDSEAAYRVKKANSLTLTEMITKKQEELKQERKERYRVEKKQQALPVIKGYQHEIKQLDNYPEHIAFPENGLERLETLNEKLLPLKSELSVLQDNRKKYEEKQDLIRAEMYENPVYKAAEEIISQKQNYLHNEKEMGTVQESIKKLDLQIDTELDQLNIGIAKEDLETINLPFHLEKTWNQLKNDADQLALSKEQLQQEYRQIIRNRDYLNNQQRELNDSLLEENHAEELTKRISDYNQHVYMEKVRQESASQQNKWKKMKEKSEKNAKVWLLTGSIVAILLGAFAFVQSQPLLLSVSILILAVAVFQSINGRKSFQTIENMLQSEEIADSQITPAEKREAEQLLEINDKKKNELLAVKDRLRSVDIEMLQWNEKNSGFEQKEKRLAEQINSQHEQYPFLQQLEIMYWPELFHTLKNVTKLDRDKKQFEKQYNQLLTYQDAFKEKVVRFFLERNWELPNKSTAETLLVLEELLDDYQKKTTLLEQYEKWIAENEDKQREMKKKMQVYEKEITDLFSIAGSETEDEFIKQGRLLEEKRSHERELAQLNDQLVRILPEEIRQEVLQKEVIPDGELDVHHKQISEQLKLLEKEIDDNRKAFADINAELSNMESSESYSEMLHRYSMEQEQLRKLAEEWSVYKTAKEMLIETKRNYRDKYLGEVIEKTTHYFRTLTDNNYMRIYPPQGNKPFRAETDDGIRYNVNELSQGTVDQLYVSLRLGISEIMSEKHRLPFIIDDAFVHFDSVRTERIIKLLSDISGKQQIILFTCKKDVIGYASDARIIDLSKSSVRIN
ncbi:ATP-binding protein [Virgibacillus doumboii]|uniref:ATP-binding protein n=1 Tax=Virgibacillus doumboii TaxID=2697503 RepID=UPI0013DF8156|nr:AAA family ATPase [Virgibacillus doumboii]